MRLLRNGKTLFNKVKGAYSLKDRLIGLLSKKFMPESEALYIPGCRAVHTFFMKFSIDVVMTDKRGKVVFIKEKLRPFRITGCLKAENTVEFKQGMAKKKKIKAGDKIIIR